MPHYRDGSLARVGDLVFGKPYNTDHRIAGEIVQITSQDDTCNCVVAFVDEVPFEKLYNNQPVQVLKVSGIGPGGSAFARFVQVKTDYGEVKAFQKLGSVFDKITEAVASGE